jgi:hypothetical protein
MLFKRNIQDTPASVKVVTIIVATPNTSVTAEIHHELCQR